MAIRNRGSTLPSLNPNAGPVYLTQVQAPTVCTAALAGIGAGSVTNGVHLYKVTFVTANGETELGYHVPSASVTVANNAVNGKVQLTNIALGAASDGVTARRIYRTWAGGSIYYLIATINDNTTTTYLDNATDSSGVDYTFRPNTTAALWLNTSLGRTRILGYPGVQNTSWGVDALASITSGYWNVAMGEGTLGSATTAQQNTAVGLDSQNRNVTGAMNTTLGIDTLYNNTAGSYNTILGAQSGVSLQGSYNTFIGKDAGLNQTAGDNNILIGYSVNADSLTGSNQINIGNTFYGDRSTGNWRLPANKILQLGPSVNTYLGFVGADAVGLFADTSAVDMFFTARSVSFNNGASAQFVIDSTNLCAFQGDICQFTPTTRNQFDNTSWFGDGISSGTVVFKTPGSVSFEAGSRVFDDQKHYFGTSGTSRYAQWANSSSRMELLATGASDTLRLGARSKAQADLADGFSLTSNLADSAGSTALLLTQSTSFSYQPILSNERRYLRILDGTSEVMRLVPSNISAATGYKSAALAIRSIVTRPDNGIGGSQSFFNGSEMFTGSKALTTSFTCVSGLASVQPANASAISTAGLDFSLLTSTPAGTGSYSTCHALRSFLQPPFSGAFNPTFGAASTALFGLYINGCDFTELNIARFETLNLGAYPTSAGTLNGVKISNDMSGAYCAATEQSGLYIANLTAAAYGTTRGFGVKIAAPSGTFTDSWGLYSEDDIAIATGKKVYYEGSSTAKGDTYHWYSSGLKTVVDGSTITTDTTTTRTFKDGFDLAIGTSTGTKIGTGTTQKIGFWNATPIVQPTTAIAASTFVANTSGIVNDTATWDGYKIGQVVKALRNLGILA